MQEAMDSIDQSLLFDDKMTGLRTERSVRRATLAANRAVAAAEAAFGAADGIAAPSSASMPAGASMPQGASMPAPAPAPAAPSMSGAEAAAKKALERATAAKAKAEALATDVESRAYAAGRASAQARVMKMEQEAKEYFEVLKEQFDSLGEPKPDPRRVAMEKAVGPYYDAIMKLQAMVASYSKEANNALASAQAMAAKAHTLAGKANYEQASGFAVPAQTDMRHAHDTIAAAEARRQQAYRSQLMAENLNDAIPAYQQAAEMALTAADYSVTQGR